MLRKACISSTHPNKKNQSRWHSQTCCSLPRSRAWQGAWYHCFELAWATVSSGPVGNPAANESMSFCPKVTSSIIFSSHHDTLSTGIQSTTAVDKTRSGFLDTISVSPHHLWLLIICGNAPVCTVEMFLTIVWERFCTNSCSVELLSTLKTVYLTFSSSYMSLPWWPQNWSSVTIWKQDRS